VFVRDLEVQSTQSQLGRSVMVITAQVRREECFDILPQQARPAQCPIKGRLDTPSDFVDRLNGVVAPSLNGNRLLLVNRYRYVVYDSNNESMVGQQVAPATAGKAFLDSAWYFVAAQSIQEGQDPLHASFVVVAQPQDLAVSVAAGELASRLLEAGAAALVVAMLLALFISRSMTGPLTQLAGAAEDIAAGNYSRRVNIKGPDELGMLGLAFNRMADAVERARKAQRDFLANVSHELKTPLTSLIGFSQALVDGSVLSDTERTRAATIVHEESERVLRMAQELLDLARVESGSISMHITSVDLAGQLQQEMEMVRPRAAARGLVLKTSVPDDIPPVAADPERLHQIIDNLLDNAVKYAPENSAVSAAARLSGGAVETVVSNAAGEHRPDPDRMFDRFYRADPSRSSAAGGVGLGLSISRELANAMKGRLWADFDDTGNLRLHLMLPAAREPVSATPAAQEASPGSRSAA
jgi:signal transduction histidine kinase